MALLVVRKYYDLLRDHLVNHLTLGRKVYFKIVSPGTWSSCVEITTRRKENAREGKNDIVLDNELQLQYQRKLVRTFELDYAASISANECWKMSRYVYFFLNKKGKNHLIINIVSEGRGELAWCPKFFVRDYKLL